MTDSSRGESIFDMAPELVPLVQRKITEIGSDAASCAARCAWSLEDFTDDEGHMRQIARIKLIPDGAFLLSKAVKGRFRYQRHFTLKSDEVSAIIFFPEGFYYTIYESTQLI